MVLKKFFKRILPEVHQIREHKHLQIFGDILHDPHIFHLTRRSVAGGVATGLFVCFLPMPGHMILAALAAIRFRVNLPLAVILVWITNPVTMPPIFYLAYKLGSYILDLPHKRLTFELSWQWFSSTFMDIWPSLMLGSLIFATVASVTGYLAIRLIWRLAIINKWEARKQANLKKAGKINTEQ